MSYQDSNRAANVLILINEPSARAQAIEALSNEGYEVDQAANGQDALLALKKKVIDAFIADTEATDMPGAHVASAAARMFPDLSVIMVAESDDAEAVRAALSWGAAYYLSKPLDPSRLMVVIRRALEAKITEARKLSEERSQVLFSAIKALAAAIDAKSYFTATHSSRVTALCLLAGRALGLSSTDMATLELAAQIHDIGKIGTPDEVLEKPGSLTEVEWVDILRHPDVGSSILSHIPALSRIASVVRHHHERYDGTGYPDGLTGKAIPMMARIVAIADAYEAMTADRPYRRARNHAEAVSELQANAGTQFDPEMLGTFLAAIDGFETNKKAA